MGEVGEGSPSIHSMLPGMGPQHGLFPPSPLKPDFPTAPAAAPGTALVYPEWVSHGWESRETEGIAASLSPPLEALLDKHGMMHLEEPLAAHGIGTIKDILLWSDEDLADESGIAPADAHDLLDALESSLGPIPLEPNPNPN